MSNFWNELATRLERDASVFLAVVAASSKGSPGVVGEKLLVTRDGRQIGTIGGGPMEARIVAEARAALRRGAHATEARTVRHSDRGTLESSGLVCRGRQTNVLHLCRRREREIAVRAAGLVAEARGGTLVLGPDGLALDERPSDPSRPSHRFRRSRGGFRYEEELLERRRLAILGVGHCGRALAALMSRIGWDVLALDTRAPGRDFPRIEGVRRQEVVSDYGDAAARIDYPEITRVVVMTADHASDARALASVLKRPFPFVGLMGGSAKVRRIREDLSHEGLDRRALDRIVAPVGIPIGSETPGEIAVSVAAQLIRDHREAPPRPSPRSRRTARRPGRAPRRRS